MEQFYTSKNKAFDRPLRMRQQPSWFNPRTQNTFTHIPEPPGSGPVHTWESVPLVEHGILNVSGIKEMHFCDLTVIPSVQ